MCEINWQLLLEYLKVLLSWPPIALLITFIFFARFRLAISNLLNRVTEGNFFGQGFKAAPPNQSLESGGVAEDLLIKASEAQSNTGAQQNIETPTPLPPELANDPQALVAIEWVKGNPIQTVIEYKRLLLNYNFERLFNIIYGTQILLLEYLSSRSGETVALTQLAQFHLMYLSKPKATSYELQDYVNFLVTYGVIAVAGVPNQQTYSLTPHGVQFLAYIKTNYPLGWFNRTF